MSSKRAVYSELYSEKVKFLRVHSWFSGLTWFSFRTCHAFSVNAESHYANANYLLNLFRSFLIIVKMALIC